MSESPLSLQCISLNKAYGQRHVLKNVELSVASGEYVAIMGDSGVGKSSLLNLIAGLDKPNSGKIYIDGVEVSTTADANSLFFIQTLTAFVAISPVYMTIYQDPATVGYYIVNSVLQQANNYVALAFKNKWQLCFYQLDMVEFTSIKTKKILNAFA
jgi:ABC-type multidrug transport system ATPase subunit